MKVYILKLYKNIVTTVTQIIVLDSGNRITDSNKVTNYKL